MHPIRHSSLPKLAVSPRYVPCGEAGEAASRGTIMDAAYRAIVSANDWTLCTALPEDADRQAVVWAAERTKLLAGDDYVEAREQYCTVNTPGIDHTGTVDAKCAKRCWSIDLKTGRKRDYVAQMAAYALGLMEAEFAESWRTYLLFCDQREMEAHEWTLASAHTIIDPILDEVRDPETVCRISEYCDWCASKDTCPVRAQLAKESLWVHQHSSEDAAIQIARDRVLSSPDMMGRFILSMRLVEKEILKPAEDELRRRLAEDKDCSAEVQLVSQSGKPYFGTDAILEVAPRLGLRELVEALGGKIGGDKLRELCAAKGVDVPAHLEMPGAPFTKLVARSRRAQPKRQRRKKDAV